MRRMLMLGVAVTVVAGAGCTSGDGVPSRTESSGGSLLRVRQCATSSDVDDAALKWMAELRLAQDHVSEVVLNGRCIDTVLQYASRAEADAAAEQLEQVDQANHVYLRPIVGGCASVDMAPGSTGDLGLPPSDPAITQILRLLDPAPRVCQVGPAQATGEIFSPSAMAAVDAAGAWYVTVEFTAAGHEQFNAIATACYDRTSACPSGQIGIEFDGVLQATPTISDPSYGSTMQIAGSFTESAATALARAINAGALPVFLEVESVTVEG